MKYLATTQVSSNDSLFEQRIIFFLISIVILVCHVFCSTYDCTFSRNYSLCLCFLCCCFSIDALVGCVDVWFVWMDFFSFLWCCFVLWWRGLLFLFWVDFSFQKFTRLWLMVLLVFVFLLCGSSFFILFVLFVFVVFHVWMMVYWHDKHKDWCWCWNQLFHVLKFENSILWSLWWPKRCISWWIKLHWWIKCFCQLMWMVV